MRYLSILILCFSINASADVCGLYQVEEFREQIIHSLTDLTTQRPQVFVHVITNSSNLPVTSMIHGQCYCVRAKSIPNPDFSGDLMYSSMEILELTRGPFKGCTPIPL